jgi:hypothetical protein
LDGEIEVSIKHISHRSELDFDAMGPTDPSGLTECKNKCKPKINKCNNNNNGFLLAYICIKHRPKRKKYRLGIK